MWSVGASASHAPSKTSWPSRSIEASNPTITTTSPGKRFTDSRGWVLESHNLSTERKTDHLHLFVVSFHLQRRTSWPRISAQPQIQPPVRAVQARGGVADNKWRVTLSPTQPLLSCRRFWKRDVSTVSQLKRWKSNIIEVVGFSHNPFSTCVPQEENPEGRREALKIGRYRGLWFDIFMPLKDICQLTPVDQGMISNNLV